MLLSVHNSIWYNNYHNTVSITIKAAGPCIQYHFIAPLTFLTYIISWIIKYDINLIICIVYDYVYNYKSIKWFTRVEYSNVVQMLKWLKHVSKLAFGT